MADYATVISFCLEAYPVLNSQTPSPLPRASLSMVNLLALLRQAFSVSMAVLGIILGENHCVIVNSILFRLASVQLTLPKVISPPS
jgi:hypothetical protein